ncbi:RNA polymerase factor sigma-54 [Marinobacterium arenosum]|uniref:RNA polymerase factor sigma-54 n=1 Tax=Marinobacterium arenosum TaxID=2862496 RepID=UPI001C941161|nr:RNA polymerase factor sigma-54 [Marinobacterium arenosum]MBY4676760.1 RNA polymerase factor sigma-54 [Marinobacterium arenosum]
MKQALQLKIGQQLTMTPQLQQAIRLLQLSTLDLQQEIQEALDNNPMLETGEDDHEAPAEQEQHRDQQAADDSDKLTASASDDSSEQDDSQLTDDNWKEDIPDELGIDSSWDDTFQSALPSSASRDDFDLPQENDSAEETLQDHLLWQLNLTPMSDSDQLIAQAIIDGIEPDGYLTVSLEEILEHFQQSEPELFGEAELDEVEAVLHRVQQFDPAGVAARDLSECLLLQLAQLPKETPLLKEACALASQHLALLGSRDYRQLMRKTRLKEAQLQQVISLIQSLNPKPGATIASGKAEYVIPDVIVQKIRGVWTVALNPDISPRLRINSSYADLIRRADNSADNTYLKNHLQEARWFIKSLLSRNETLLKVAREIVNRQSDFLEHGDEAMKPMVLHDIAEAVEMHESTISRVTTQKYMHTPRGIFELKYFFSSHVSTSDGGAASSTAIRAVIKKLVAAENPAKPLSDNKITQLLEEQGIKVARRTIAKYREAMAIPPSNERKRLV